MFVGVFFFYSGYGLKKSIKNNPHYLDGFLKRKIASIYFPFLIAETCHALLTAYYNNDYSNLFLRCVGFQLSNSILWYVVEILAMYILFYLFEKRHIPIVEGRASQFRLSEIIGNNSYYIYLWHGFFICLYSHYIRDSKLVALCVVVTTILFSLLYGRIKESMSYKKYRDKG